MARRIPPQDCVSQLRFDRGTLILPDSHRQLAEDPELQVLWDFRTQVARAPAWCYPQIATKIPSCARAIAVQLEQDVPSWRTSALRPYQEAALRAWTLANCRGVIVLPTGSGKTHVGLGAAAKLRRSTLFMVPTRVLLAQWLDRIRSQYAGPVGCLGDGSREIEQVTVATFESAYRHMQRLGARFHLLVVDEVHHFGRGQRDEALEMSLAPARLGLTATPPDPASEAKLDPLVGSRVYELAIGDLLGDALSDYDLITWTLELTPEERSRYTTARAAFRSVYSTFVRHYPRASWSDFARMAQGSAGGRRALEGLRESKHVVAFPAAKRNALREILARHREQRVLVFTGDNETAYAVAREHLLMPITCDIGRSERAAVLERFARGELRALVSARVLNEGLDVPEAEVAVVVAGSQGVREFVQRVGRLLRPRPGKRALIHELVMRDTAEVWHARRRRKGLAPRASA